MYAVGLNVVMTDDFDFAFFLGCCGVINCILLVPFFLALDIWSTKIPLDLTLKDFIV
jgi:hypothetical protein